jgi:hypothetical protein
MSSFPVRHAIPSLLNELLASGVWPADAKAAWVQEFRSLVALERVRRFAPEEDRIYLSAPPFRTIADELESAPPSVVGGFWKKLWRLDQIVPEKTLILGDFGIGSDAPIILDYTRNPADPPVFRLRYGADGHTDWVQGARNFAEFVDILGLTGTVK